MLNKSKT